MVLLNQPDLLVTFSLGYWWETLSAPQQVFWVISIVFSILFLIQFVFSLLGLDFDSEGDADFHTDVAAHDFTLDTDFTLLSVRGIIAFFTFFGWTGVLALNAGLGVLLSLALATLSGIIAMALVAYLIFLFSRLTQEGNLDIRKTIRTTGEVYLTIPANKNGTGKIHIKVEGVFREIEAVTAGDTLPTGTKIKVVEVIDENLLLVEPVDSFLSNL